MGWAGKQQLPEIFASRCFQQTALGPVFLFSFFQYFKVEVSNTVHAAQAWRNVCPVAQPLIAGARSATGTLTAPEPWLSTQRMPLNGPLNSLAQRLSVSVIHRVNSSELCRVPGLRTTSTSCVRALKPGQKRADLHEGLTDPARQTLLQSNVLNI